MENDLALVLARAIESYQISKSRSVKAKLGRAYDGPPFDELYPDHYERLKNGHMSFVGQTADEILEEYLETKGHPPASKEYFKLAEIVIAQAEGR